MKQYTDGKRTIYATEKAYEVLYKQKGFRPLEEVLAQAKELAEAKAAEEAEARTKAEAEAKAAEEAAARATEQAESQQEPLPPLEEALAEGEPGEPINLEELTVKELQEIAQEHGIDAYSRMKKAELIAALEGGGADAGEA